MESESVITRTIIKEIPVHVTARSDARYPLPYGAVRVYDAAILGTDPSALSLPKAQLMIPPRPLRPLLWPKTPPNYAGCRESAVELMRLEQWLREVGKDTR